MTEHELADARPGRLAAAVNAQQCVRETAVPQTLMSRLAARLYQAYRSPPVRPLIRICSISRTNSKPRSLGGLPTSGGSASQSHGTWIGAAQATDRGTG